MSDEREPLWSDTEIAEIIAGMASKWEAAILYSILRGKRDDYEARIAELEAQLAAERAATNEWKTLANIHGRRMLELEAQLAQRWEPIVEVSPWEDSHE